MRSPAAISLGHTPKFVYNRTDYDMAVSIALKIGEYRVGIHIPQPLDELELEWAKQVLLQGYLARGT